MQTNQRFVPFIPKGVISKRRLCPVIQILDTQTPPQHPSIETTQTYSLARLNGRPLIFVGPHADQAAELALAELNGEKE